VNTYLPIFLHLVAVIAFAAFTLLAPHLIAPRKPSRVKSMPYESGMDPEDDARKPLNVQFYLIAILFIVFDVEFLYLYPWAVTLGGGIAKEVQGWVSASVALLLLTLGIAYVYALRKGVFDWRRM
jgi:NADH-quinone oxidoreductase subunit A